MPFTSHLAELRSRLIKSFLALAVGFAACFAVADSIFAVLAAPLTLRCHPERSEGSGGAGGVGKYLILRCAQDDSVLSTVAPSYQ